MSDGYASARAVEIFSAVNFLVIGASHLLRPKEWIELFAKLRGLGPAGAFVNGFLSLLMGSVIVAFHRVWTFPGLILTVIGWLYLAKSLIVFVSPRTGLRSLDLAAAKDASRIRLAGLVLCILALALGAGVATGVSP